MRQLWRLAVRGLRAIGHEIAARGETDEAPPEPTWDQGWPRAHLENRER